MTCRSVGNRQSPPSIGPETCLGVGRGRGVSAACKLISKVRVWWARTLLAAQLLIHPLPSVTASWSSRYQFCVTVIELLESLMHGERPAPYVSQTDQEFPISLQRAHWKLCSLITNLH